MSYDLEVRSDDQYSKSTDLGSLQEFLSGLKDVQMCSEILFEYRVPQRDLYVGIFLEFFDNSEEALDSEHSEISPAETTINCVLLAIPYGHMHRDDRDQLYINLGQTIARHLGSRLYDNQRDEYLLE